MDELIGLLVTVYVIASVIIAFIKRAQQGPAREEWAEKPVEPPRPIDQRVAPPLEGPRTIQTQTISDRPSDQGSVQTFTIEDGFEAPADDFEATPKRHGSDRVRSKKAKVSSKARMTDNDRKASHLFEGPDALRQGMLLAEVLGPPRAMRRTHRLEGTHLHNR